MNLIEYFNKFVRIITFLTPVTDCCMSFPSISGSYFFLKFNNEFIVITAGHVFKDFSVENLKILLNPFAKNTNDSHRLLSLAGGFNFFNGSRVDVNYDADAYDFCILNVAKEELEEDLNSFFGGIFSATKFIFQFSLAYIADHIHKQPEVRIKYFVPDEHKSGGAIIEFSGKVKKISAIDGTIVMADGCKIRLSDIVDLSIG